MLVKIPGLWAEAGQTESTLLFFSCWHRFQPIICLFTSDTRWAGLSQHRALPDIDPLSQPRHTDASGHKDFWRTADFWWMAWFLASKCRLVCTQFAHGIGRFCMCGSKMACARPEEEVRWIVMNDSTSDVQTAEARLLIWKNKSIYKTVLHTIRYSTHTIQQTISMKRPYIQVIAQHPLWNCAWTDSDWT